MLVYREIQTLKMDLPNGARGPSAVSYRARRIGGERSFANLSPRCSPTFSIPLDAQ